MLLRVLARLSISLEFERELMMRSNPDQPCSASRTEPGLVPGLLPSLTGWLLGEGLFKLSDHSQPSLYSYGVGAGIGIGNPSGGGGFGRLIGVASGFGIVIGVAAGAGAILTVGLPSCLSLSWTTFVFSSESVVGLGLPLLPPPGPPHQAGRLLDASKDAVNKIAGIAFFVSVIVFTPLISVLVPQ